MAVNLDKIVHLEHAWEEGTWKKFSFSRKWRKRQMNRYIRRNNKDIDEDETGYKTSRKPYKGWEW